MEHDIELIMTTIGGLLILWSIGFFYYTTKNNLLIDDNEIYI
jgi:hypothetical protein